MGDRRLIVTATAAGLAAVFLWMLLTLPPRARAVDLSGWPDDRSPPTARGAFHVHSDRSDGSAAVEDIAAAASRAGLQFVIFTDHGDGTRAPDPPVYRSGVLCIDAVEISTSGGHYIALGMPASPYPLAGEPHAVVEDVRRLGGFGIVAHPGSAKAGLGWTDFGLAYDGIEWLNGDSQWRDESRRALGGAVVRYLLRPSEVLAALLDRPGPLLAQWDDSTRRRQVVALAGADAHAHLASGARRDGDDDRFALAFPGYEHVFRVFSINVELDREFAGDEAAAADAALLLAGIRAGRVFTVIDMVAAPARFSFEGRTGDRRHPMGTRVETRPARRARREGRGTARDPNRAAGRRRPGGDGHGQRARRQRDTAGGLSSGGVRSRGTGCTSDPVDRQQPDLRRWGADGRATPRAVRHRFDPGPQRRGVGAGARHARHREHRLPYGPCPARL